VTHRPTPFRSGESQAWPNPREPAWYLLRQILRGAPTDRLPSPPGREPSRRAAARHLGSGPSAGAARILTGGQVCIVLLSEAKCVVRQHLCLTEVTGADFRAGRFAREIGFVIHAADVAAAF
jgi:hypothetical protein